MTLKEYLKHQGWTDSWMNRIEEVTINNQPFIKINYGKDSIMYWAYSNKYIVELTFYNEGVFKLPPVLHDQTIDQILSTFKFLDE